MGEVFGSIGNLISAGNTEDAIQEATNWQTRAIQQSIENVNKNATPGVVNQQATDITKSNIASSMAEQQKVDPILAALRGTSQQDIATKLQETQNLTDQGSQANRVAAAATQGALNQPPGLQAGTNALIDAALEEVKQGATLPPDLQAELVQSGLQTGAQSYGHAVGTGAGGTILNQVLGSAGIALQKQRQDQAQNLLSTASNLNAQRQSILSSLFPSLAQTQLGQTAAGLTAAGGVLNTSNSMMPNLGISGSDAANVWLNRIGAQNALTQQKAGVGAQGKLGTTEAQNQKTAAEMALANSVFKIAATAFGGPAGAAIAGMAGDTKGGGGGGGGGDIMSMLGGML